MLETALGRARRPRRVAAGALRRRPGQGLDRRRGRGVRRYLRWAAYQAAEGRASDTILPERDHDAVRLMTVHAAKGLEFPITIVSGLTTKPRGESALSVLWPGDSWMLAERDNDAFQAYQPLDEQMGDAERRRLLYVACTRAVDHLVVSCTARPRTSPESTGRRRRPVPRCSPRVAASDTVHASSRVWSIRSRRRPATSSSCRGRTTSSGTPSGPGRSPWRRCVRRPARPAPRLATAMRQCRTRADAGLQKDAVDLDLPPWQRGRYGTAVGRAVHAVLQDADLGDGADIDELAAAQCAAEGIFGLEERVAALSRSALTAPIVVAAAGGAQHWRELFVVAQLGDTVVEGYIDLLVRTPEGLVIVDYKTDQWKPGSDASARASPATATSSPPTASSSAGCSTNRSSAACSCAAGPISRPSRSPSRGGPRRSRRWRRSQLFGDAWTAAHRRPLLARHARRADDGADALEHAGDQPADGGEGEDDGEGDPEGQE